MQVTGTFPQLSDGRKKSRKRTKTAAGEGFGGFGISGRGPRRVNAPKTLTGRRNASHKKAYGD